MPAHDTSATGPRRPHTHGLRTMTGRDPDAGHRAATPLELLYDLVFVISFGVAGSEFAHLVAEGFITEGLLAFGLAMFAVVWAWINYTWFASAFDTDDWVQRLLVMVQMMGVVVLAMGLPALFDSVHHHEPVALTAVLIGYIIMRSSMIAMWMRVHRQDPANRGSARIYITTLLIAQAAWCLVLVPDVQITQFLLLSAPIFLIEMAGPVLAERQEGGTPWHPHHVAERYGLLAIISFGEILIGTVAALEVVLEHDGWTTDIALITVFGVALTLGLWWVYFNVPAAEALEVQRDKSFVWGYGHLFVYSAISAVGAGLHVAALWLEDHAAISDTAVMASIAVPAALVMISSAALFGHLLEWFSGGWALMAVKLGVCVVSVVAVSVGINVVWGLGILLLAPIISVVAQELGVGQKRDDHLDALTG